MIGSIIPMMHLLASLLDESRHACKNFMRSSNDHALAKFIAKGITMESRAQRAIEHGATNVRGASLRHTTAARRLLKNAAEAQDRYPPQNGYLSSEQLLRISSYNRRFTLSAAS